MRPFGAERLEPAAARAIEICTLTYGSASKVLVITGGPGFGKATLVNSILKILLAKDRRHRAMCAYGSRCQTPI